MDSLIQDGFVRTTRRNKMPDRTKEEFIVKNEGLEYEISKFLHFHPGGRNTLVHLQDRDIDKKLQEYKHSTAAQYLMRDYKVDTTSTTSTEPEDLEKLVDWSKPMCQQVGSLGDKYQQWVLSPVDRKLRLFESDILETLTLAPWYVVVSVWLPIIAIIMSHGYFFQNPNGISTSTTLLLIISGIICWSLLEYTLHRWLFHRVPSPTSPQELTMHFTLHGLHHKVPFDSTRLLFPPVPAMTAGLIIYTGTYLTLPYWMVSLVASGIAIGYLMYDLTHFYLHYGSPKPDSYLYHMKRYHNRHHFTHHDMGYGISSDFWDRIFDTEIILPKLMRNLKW